MTGSPRRRPLPGRLIDASAAARVLGVDVHTLRRWHACGAGPPAARAQSSGLAFWSSAVEQWQERVLGRFGTLPRRYPALTRTTG
jgi:hypothetical protein